MLYLSITELAERERLLRRAVATFGAATVERWAADPEKVRLINALAAAGAGSDYRGTAIDEPPVVMHDTPSAFALARAIGRVVVLGHDSEIVVVTRADADRLAAAGYEVMP